MANGLRYSANERKKNEYHNTPIEERQKKHQDLKKKRNRRCANDKCKKLISYGSKSGLCQSCFQTKAWKERKKGK